MIVLTDKQKVVLRALGVYLYVHRKEAESLLNIKLTYQMRWKAGSNVCESRGTTWQHNEFIGIDIREYMDKGGLLYDNEKCKGEGMIWPITGTNYI